MGKTYLVYANQTNTEIFIHPDSRTMLIEEPDASRDLKMLGASTLNFSNKGLNNYLAPVLGFSILISLVVLLVVFMVRKRNNLSTKSAKVFILFALLAGIFSAACNQKVQDQLRFAMASARGDTILVNELLKKKTIDVNALNGEIGPAIISASYGGHIEVVQLLLNNGATVNIRDKNGTTALMNAVIGERPDVVRLLLENGADVNVALEKTDVNKNPVTAKTFARIKGNREIMNLLEVSP